MRSLGEARTQRAGVYANTRAAERESTHRVAGSMRLITQLDSLVDAEQTEQTAGCLFSGGMSSGELNRIENASITGQGRMQSSARLLPAPMLIREVRLRESCEFEFVPSRLMRHRSFRGIQFRHGTLDAERRGDVSSFPNVRADYFWSTPIYRVLW